MKNLFRNTFLSLFLTINSINSGWKIETVVESVVESIGYINYFKQLNKLEWQRKCDKKDTRYYKLLLLISPPLIALGYGFLPTNNPQINNLTAIRIAVLRYILFSCGIANALGVIIELASKDKNLDLKPFYYSLAMLGIAYAAYCLN